MGEIADMMINGELCTFCGCYIEAPDGGHGFPVYCSEECRKEHDVDPEGAIVDDLLEEENHDDDDWFNEWDRDNHGARG